MCRLLKLASFAIFLSTSLAALAEDDDTVESSEGDWYVSQMATFTNDDGDRRLDDSIGGGEFRVGWKWTDTFALEGLLGYHRIDGWPSWPAVTDRQYQEFLDVGLNVVTSFNTDGDYSPYLIFGAGYLGTETELGVTDNGASGTAGLGMKVRFGDSPWSMRAEYRMRHAFGGDNSYTDGLTSLGVRYAFGGTSGGTSASTAASAFTGSEAVMESDSDGDGIVDKQDACPNSPQGIPVNPAGCLQDIDQDGVADERDQCTGTGAGAEVDANGCDIIELKPVYFETESAAITRATKHSLDEAAAILLRNPDVQVEIGGHADSSGPENYNMKLSKRRAEAVRGYLEQAGVDSARMTVRGYGESRPIASNETITGRADNRRVELKLLDR
jgi:OOP family OmpA-OmpF porin